MTTDPQSWPEPLSARHRPWSGPLSRPRMSNAEDVRPGVSLTSRYLEFGGVPAIPASGEIHYSRLPRDRWEQRLRQMRAGGVTVAASYAFWLHHVPERGEPCFDGNLDVAAFVDLCAATGLQMILRIGPWCHGEARNGGFPDWVQQAPVRHRTDDPAYLELVREWFGQLAAALGGRCGPGGTVLGIQLENELYDEPGHLVTLKTLAREAGLSAPLWTATAWGGADLPPLEVLPLYGGYGDGFWVDADAPWDPTFRDHYFFSHVWDDPGIGADVRRTRSPSSSSAPRTPSEFFPPATCELGGGMATAYHRRPRPEALDVATVAHCKIGNGSAWQGYYMYTGGTNPPGRDGMQESHATGYPNDVPRLGYDFHAPIGESGVLAPSHAELRRQHAFLAAFGARLADMPSSLPERRPAGVEDRETLRWALRSDGTSGFVFLAWHQPHFPLATYRSAQFCVALAPGREIVFPSTPVDVPAGTLARWPVGLTAGGVRIDWATASALTLLPGPVPTLVLTAEAGIEPSLSAGGSARAVRPSLTPTRLTGPGGALDVLVLPASQASRIWVCEDGPQRRLLLSAAELSWGPDGRIEALGSPEVQVYDPAARAFTALPVTPAGESAQVTATLAGESAQVTATLAGESAQVTATLAGESAQFTATLAAELTSPPAPTVPVTYGKYDGRQSAPSPATFDELAAVFRLPMPSWAAEGALDTLVSVDWAGDVAQLRVDGRTVTDRFWDGSRWTISLRDAGYRDGSTVTLHVLPLAVGSPVRLPTDAGDRLVAAEGQLLAVDAVEVTGRRTWREMR